MRWIVAATASAVGLALWFLHLRGCLRFWPVVISVAFVLVPWLFVFLLIGLKWKQRALLGAVAFGVLFLTPLHTNPMPVAAAESSAVGALLRLKSAIQLHGSNGAQEVIAGALSKGEMRFPVQNFYRFDYDQQENGFRIAAILLPQARACGCIRNFTITTDGTVHYTSEPRSATPNDPIVEIPSGLLQFTAR